MLYNLLGIAYSWRQVQAYTDPMSMKCWASVAGAGQYLFSPSQYSCWWYRHDNLNQSWVDVGPLSVMLAQIQRGAKHLRFGKK